MGYTSEFDGLIPGTDTFNKTWKALAKNPKFDLDQHQYIKKTHYDRQMEFLKEKGIDLSNRGPAIQDLIWSTAVQFRT